MHIVHAREEAFKEDKLNILEYQFPPVINNYSCTLDNQNVEIVLHFEDKILHLELQDSSLPSEIIKNHNQIPQPINLESTRKIIPNQGNITFPEDNTPF